MINFHYYQLSSQVTSTKGRLVFFLMGLLLNLPNRIVGQEVINSVIFEENFYNNALNWNLSNDNTIQTAIKNNRYFIDFDSYKAWNKKIGVPNNLKLAFEDDEVELSFYLNFEGRNGASTSGLGFTFDKVATNYNIVYIGEEFGKVFSSIIPRRNGAFRKPIKEGGNIPYVQSKSYHIRIVKNLNLFKIYIDDALILSFYHDQKLVIDSLYFTTGKYAISKIKVIKSSIRYVNIEKGESKEFNPHIYNMYLLLVGINKYPSNKIKPLNSSINDIKAIRNFYMSNSGGRVPKENISFLADGDATKTNVENNLQMIVKKASSNDVIIIYLSGHGIYSGSFACYDQELNYSEINKIIASSKAKNKLVIVDACYSGSIENIITSPGKDEITQEQLQTMFKYRISMADKGTSYLLSCSAFERSYDGTPNTNSEFTKALLLVLNKQLNKKTGEVLTLSEAYELLKDYFTIWNNKNSTITYKELVRTPSGLIPIEYKKVMNPQLISSSNKNNLPVAIISK